MTAVTTPAKERNPDLRDVDALLALSAPFFSRRLHQCAQASDAALAAVLPKDLTSGQAHLLWAVDANQPCSQTRLTEVMGMDRSTLADVVRRLARRKLLTRQRTKDDARMYAVKLTEDGRALLREVKPLILKAERPLRAKILNALQAA